MRKVIYVLLLMLAVSTTALASDEFYYKGLLFRVIDNNSVELINSDYWECAGSVTIPDIVCAKTGMYERFTVTYIVRSIGEAAFSRNSSLTDIVIPQTVTSIGSSAFAGCTGLTSITIPNSVTEIGSEAFSFCSSLTQVTIPNSVREMGWNVFYDCSGLTSVTISQSVRQLNGTFGGCTSLTHVDIPASVTVLDRTFTGCTSLTSVEIPASVIRVGESTFRGCTSLASVYIPNSVTSIGNQAFSNTALTSIEIPASVKKLGEDAFYGCDQLMAITSRPVNPPVMTNQGCFTDYVYNMATLTVPAAGLDSYRGTNWWNLFDAENLVGNAALDHAYDFESGGLYYIITGNSTVSVTSMEGGLYSGAITVPATVSYNGHTYQVTGIGIDAFSGCTGLTSITLPSSVTRVGAQAFKGCNGLQSISFPQALEVIGESALMDCNGLTALTIPAAVKSIGQDAFAGITGLTSLTWNATSCHSNGNLITAGLTHVEVGEGVQVLPLNFVAGAPITAITLPSSLTTIEGWAFTNCTGLTEIVIPEGVSVIGEKVFEGCSSLAALEWNARDCYTNGDMPTWQLSQVDIGAEVEILPVSLASGSTITSVDIPESVKKIGNSAFANCLNLTEIIIPDEVEYIGTQAFFGCEYVTNIVIGKSVNLICENAFAMCYRCTSLSWNARYCESRGDMTTSQIEHLTIGNEVTVLPQGLAANSCITEVNIPNSVIKIGPEDYSKFEGAFEGCFNLTHVEIPNSVEYIWSRAFCGCRNLTTVTLTESLKEIGCDAFAYCASLTDIDIPNTVNSIENGAFLGCTSLSSITLPESLESISYRCFKESGLVSVTIPNSVRYLEESAFEDCRALKQIVLPNSIKDIPQWFCSRCSSLASIKIPDQVETIGDAAFWGCTSLKSVYIPKSVRHVYSEAFEGCTGLTKVTIQGIDDNYKYLYLHYAFSYCPNLTDVTCLSMTPPQSYSSFNPVYETATLHVPQTAVETYRAANDWKQFTNIVGIPGSGPGDVNGDGALDIDDVTILIDMLLNGEELPAYADLNGDGVADIDDVTILISRLLNGN